MWYTRDKTTVLLPNFPQNLINMLGGGGIQIFPESLQPAPTNSRDGCPFQISLLLVAAGFQPAAYNTSDL